MNRRLFFQKFFVVSILFLLGFYLYGFVERDFRFFSISKPFSVEFFLTERMDPVNFSFESLKEATDVFQKKWVEKVGQPIKVYFREISSDSIFEKDELGVSFFYTKEVINGRDAKKFQDFDFSSKAMEVLTKFANLNDEEPEKGLYTVESITKGFKNYKEALIDVSYYKKDNYEKLRKEFPEIVYSLEEIQLLLGNGYLAILSGTFNYWIGDEAMSDSFINESYNFKRANDIYLNRAIIGHAPYFYKKRFFSCWWLSINQRLEISAVIILFILLFLKLFSRTDIVSLLEREFGDRKIEIPLMFKTNFYLLSIFFPIGSNFAQFIADKIKKDQLLKKEKKASQKISGKVKKVWTELVNKDNHAKKLFKSATGSINKNRHTLSSREVALRQLEELLSKEKKRNLYSGKPNGNTTENIVYVKKNGGMVRQRKKNKLIRKIKENISSDFYELIESFNFRELENFRQALIRFESIQFSGDNFLKRSDFRDLLKNSNDFMDSVRLNKCDEIGEVVLKKEVLSGLRSVKKIKKLPGNLRVDLFFGAAAQGRKQDLVDALIELGVKREYIDVHDAEKVRRIEAVSKKYHENRLIITTSAIPHNYNSHLEKSSVRNLFIHAKSKEDFRRQVSEGFWYQRN